MVQINTSFRRDTMNTKLILSALGLVAMLTSPAFAQKMVRQPRTTEIQSPVAQYPDFSARTGSAASQFDQDHGYYAPGSRN
jgi:hypothetical protein